MSFREEAAARRQRIIESSMDVTGPVIDAATQDQAPAQVPESREMGIADFLLQGGYEALKTLPPFDLIDTLGDMAQMGGSSTEAGLSTMADWASYGTADSMAALDASVEALLTGADPVEAYTTTQEAVNQNLQENREEFKTATTIGDIAGAIAGGGPGIKAITKVPTMIGRLFVGSLGAGSQAGLYAINSDGSAQEIKDDVGAAMFGSALLGGAGMAAGGIGRVINNKFGVGNYAYEAGQELIKAVKNKVDLGVTDEAMRLREAKEILKNTNDPRTVLVDAYPELRDYIPRVMNAPDNPGQRQFLDLLKHRNMVEDDFSTAITDVVNMPRLRSKEEFSAFIEQRQAAIRPKYDDLFDGLEQRNVSAMPKRILGTAKRIASSRDDADTSYMRDAITRLQKALSKGSRKDETGRNLNRISARELHNIRRTLSKGYTTKKGAYKVPTRGDKLMADILSETINSMDPNYGKLARTYANTSRQKTAYDRGYKMFSSKQKASPSEFQDYLSDASSYAEVTAFTHGVRRKLFEDMSALDTPNKVRNYMLNNGNRIEQLRAAFGTQQADAIVQSVIDTVAREETRQIGNRAVMAAVDYQPNNNTRATITNAALATLPGGNSPAAIRARSRLIGEDTMSPAAQAAQSDVIGRALTSPVRDAQAILQELATIGQRGPTPLTGVGAVTAAPIASTTEPE